MSSAWWLQADAGQQVPVRDGWSLSWRKHWYQYIYQNLVLTWNGETVHCAACVSMNALHIYLFLFVYFHIQFVHYQLLRNIKN